MTTLLSLPAGKLSRSRTVPQLIHVSPVIAKLLVFTVRAVNTDELQLTTPPFPTRCNGPRMAGNAFVSCNEEGSCSVTVSGPVADVICCARSVSFWMRISEGGERYEG